MTVSLLTGDCPEVLKTLPDCSVQCCVTSPPYYGLRDYGTAKWEASNKNIADLEKTIRDEVKLIKFTVKGKYYRAEYGKPRKSWIADRLEAYTETHPDIKSCYTEGDPSVAIKRIG